MTSLATTPISQAAIWHALEAVPDPEIPVVSLRELGILRGVAQQDDGVWQVTITPTYSGCPAMAQIAEDIGSALQQVGVTQYRIHTELSPAWTTDWITADAKDKLRAYGIAPPAMCHQASSAATQPLNYKPWREHAAQTHDAPACPRCGSPNTQVIAQHGSTACKALYKCISCQEPFDYFKPY